MSVKLRHEKHEIWNICCFALMSEKRCSNAVFADMIGHGKSSCFSEVTFLTAVDPDYPMSNSPHIDGEDFLECAL
jgi:hypothetical protein